MKKITTLLFAGLMMVSVSACSEKPQIDEGQVLVEEGQVIEQDMAPISGFGSDGVNVSTIGNNNGAAPGTQQDLVVNIGDRIFFGYDSSTLTAEARTTLERQAQWMQQYSSLSVTIEGHADERGTREYNLALGDRRATAVRNYLVALGVSPMRISTISYGKERPAVVGSDPASWAQNRRGVTTIN